jgi:hypothetical protein
MIVRLLLDPARPLLRDYVLLGASVVVMLLPALLPGED